MGREVRSCTTCVAREAPAVLRIAQLLDDRCEVVADAIQGALDPSVHGGDIVDAGLAQTPSDDDVAVLARLELAEDLHQRGRAEEDVRVGLLARVPARAQVLGGKWRDNPDRDARIAATDPRLRAEHRGDRLHRLGVTRGVADPLPIDLSDHCSVVRWARVAVGDEQLVQLAAAVRVGDLRQFGTYGHRTARRYEPWHGPECGQLPVTALPLEPSGLADVRPPQGVGLRSAHASPMVATCAGLDGGSRTKPVLPQVNDAPVSSSVIRSRLSWGRPSASRSR